MCVRCYSIFQLASGRIENRPERVILMTGPCIEPVRVMSVLPSYITLIGKQQNFSFTHTIQTVNDCIKSLSNEYKTGQERLINSYQEEAEPLLFCYRVRRLV